MICVEPLSVKNPRTGEYISVPCGTCYACQSARRNAWAFRNLVEMHYSECAYFITLTYDDEHLLSLPYHATGIRLAVKSHYQKFLKRFRKSLSGVCVRYFLCHEYGNKSYRPHYHAILYFDKYLDLPTVRAAVASSWSYGFTSCFVANEARIHYLTKYITKQFRAVKSSGRSAYYIFHGDWDNKELREKYIFEFIQKKFSFVRASQGLGCQLLTEQSFISWFWNHFVPGESYPTYSIGGRSYVLPRIYLHRLIPELFRSEMCPDIRSITRYEKMEELASDANLSLPEYIRNNKYIQARRLAMLRKEHEKNPL